MSIYKCSLLRDVVRGAIVCICAVASVAAEQPGDRIDKLFEKFNGHSPGCAVGVSQNGKAVFAKGYGMADLEHNVPLSPESRFYMASVSKQFTAMSILLLAEDGKIQLSDSIRKTIPELPDYANGITLYHLLTHTSGVRDYSDLGSLSGLPPDYVFTDRGVLRSIARQNALDFEPGTDFLYSNSGYVLLSLVVKRVTQKNLNEFAQERLFVPLGMKSTLFQHDHSALLPGKVFGYKEKAGAWHTSNSMLDIVGDGGLYSSLGDMLRWVENFDNQRIGAKALGLMQTPAKLSNGADAQFTLNSGKVVRYGMGLIPDEYRGLPIVWHSGGLGGYVVEDLWFPSQRFSVVCLCNDESAEQGLLARQVAEIYLSSEMKPLQTVTQQAGVPLTREEVRAKSGLFRNEGRGYIEIVDTDGKLNRRDAPGELIAFDKHTFSTIKAQANWKLKFDDRSPALSFELASPGQPPLRYERAEPVMLDEIEAQAYAGEFVSRELGAIGRIFAGAEGLSFELGDRPAAKLEKLRNPGPDRMLARLGGEFVELVFSRDSNGKVNGFDLNAGEVHNLHFQRI